MIEKKKLLDVLEKHIESLRVGMDRLQRINATPVAKMEQSLKISAYNSVFKSIEKMDNK